MLRYILRRLGASVILLLVVTLMTFVIFYVVPRLAGRTTEQLATMYVGRAPTEAAIQATIKRLNLDQPLIIQFWEFIKGIVLGADYTFGNDVVHCAAPCFGYSFQTYQEVFPAILERLPITFSLGLGAAVLWLVGGVAVGVIFSRQKRQHLRPDLHGPGPGRSLPPHLLHRPARLGLPRARLGPVPQRPVHAVHRRPHRLGLRTAAAVADPGVPARRTVCAETRAGMLETMGEDYIRTARAKGLKESRVILKHGLRPTLTPILTIFGLDIGLVLGGAVLTEQVYSLNGIGRFAVTAIVQSDLPVILGVTLFGAFFIVLCNLAVDLLYPLVDPRVRTAR